MHIFISYAKKDTREVVEILVNQLDDLPGITTWWDQSIRPGGSWAAQIETEIDRSDLFIVLLSPDVRRDASAPGGGSFVLKEINYAQTVSKLILPVKAQPTRMPVQLADLQFIDLTGDLNQGIAEVVDYVRQLAHSSSAHSGTFPPTPVRPKTFRSTTTAQPAWRRKIGLAIGAVLLVIMLVAGVILAIGNNDKTANTPTLENTFVSENPTATEAPLDTSVDNPTEDSDSSNLATDIPTPVPTQNSDSMEIARQKVNENDEWSVVTQTFDGHEMVLVPVGCFMMGDSDESPIVEQCIEEPFWLDKYEVTNEQYGSVCSYSSESTGSQQPRNCVTWFMAHDFCDQRDARLPTEAEWEYAARGPDGLRYPWGNAFIAEKVVTSDTSNDMAADVGSRIGGESWVGAYDMSGNVSEWTSSISLDYPYANDTAHENDNDFESTRISRGGGYDTTANHVTTSMRYKWFPAADFYSFGFRCARSIDIDTLSATPTEADNTSSSDDSDATDMASPTPTPTLTPVSNPD